MNWVHSSATKSFRRSSAPSGMETNYGLKPSSFLSTSQNIYHWKPLHLWQLQWVFLWSLLCYCWISLLKIEVALNKWKTGVLVHLIFDAKIYKPIFVHHLQDLCSWLDYTTAHGTLSTKTLQFDLCTGAWSIISFTQSVWHTNINCKGICRCNESRRGRGSLSFFCQFWRQ